MEVHNYRAPNLIEIECLLLGLTIQIDNFVTSQLFGIACILLANKIHTPLARIPRATIYSSLGKRCTQLGDDDQMIQQHRADEGAAAEGSKRRNMSSS